MIEGLLSIFSGGLTGLVGAAVNTYGEVVKAKEDHRHLEKMADLDRLSMERELELGIRRAETEGQIAADIEDGKALVASYAHDKATYIGQAKGAFSRILFGFVDFFRGMIRPSATTYMVVVTSIIFWEVLKLLETMGAIQDPGKLVAIFEYMIHMILYMTSTVLFWWFGTRQKTAPPLVK